MKKLTETQINELWTIFKQSGEKAITWSHYDLADKTSINDPEVWKEFLMAPEVEAWIGTELKLIKDSEMKKIVQGAATSRSVGQAQLMTALGKLDDGTQKKEGPIFIYMHVPLNSQQKHAPNAISLQDNPFRKEE